MLKETTFGGEAAARDGVHHHRALHHNKDSHPNPWMQQVKEEIFSIDKIDVAVIRVSPAYGPDIHELKAVTAVLKLRPAFYDYSFCGEGMATAKAGAELLVWNVSASSGRLRVSGLSSVFFRSGLFPSPLLRTARLLLIFRPCRLSSVRVFRLCLALRLHFIWFRLSLRFFLPRGFVFLRLFVLCVECG